MQLEIVHNDGFMDMQNVQAQGGQSRGEKSPVADQSRGKEKMGDATEARKEPSQATCPSSPAAAAATNEPSKDKTDSTSAPAEV